MLTSARLTPPAIPQPNLPMINKGNCCSAVILQSILERKWILEDAGSRWENMVDVTVFLTNMKDDFKTYNKIYAEYFKENQPCRTTVEINCLPTPIAIELKVIAMVD